MLIEGTLNWGFIKKFLTTKISIIHQGISLCHEPIVGRLYLISKKQNKLPFI